MDDRAVSYGIDLLIQRQKTAAWMFLKLPGFAALFGGLVLVLGAATNTSIICGLFAGLIVGVGYELKVLILNNLWSRFALDFPDEARHAREDFTMIHNDRAFWQGVG